MNESSSYTGKYTHTFTATAYTGKYTHTLTQQQRWIHLEIFIILGQQKDAHHNHTRDNFTHTQSSWSLGWQEIKDNSESFPRPRVTKLQPHTSWVFILHTVLSVHKGQLTVGSFTKSNSGHPFTDVSTQPYTSKEQEPNPHTKRCEWI